MLIIIKIESNIKFAIATYVACSIEAQSLGYETSTGIYIAKANTTMGGVQATNKLQFY